MPVKYYEATFLYAPIIVGTPELCVFIIVLVDGAGFVISDTIISDMNDQFRYNKYFDKYD